MSEGIASNGFFVFAPFPASDHTCRSPLGFPVVFFRAAAIRTAVCAISIFSLLYGQDEWRLTPRLTVNYGRWWEGVLLVDIRERMNPRSPGMQSTVFPGAPKGLLFPGDPGVPDGIAPVY